MRFLLINTIASSALVPNQIRVGILRLLGFSVGPATTISAGCFFGRAMTFGEECFVNFGCFFNTTAGVHVGDRVHFGPRVSVLTSSHDIGSGERRAGPASDSPVVIESGAWIGACVTVLPGVRIGSGSVIAAGAVVTTDVPAHSLVAGVPARVVREFND